MQEKTATYYPTVIVFNSAHSILQIKSEMNATEYAYHPTLLVYLRN